MHVLATAGHVDHGKSTLVRALTGMEPDRWAEERRRGMTIDLGFAWTTLPRSGEVAFVDVPGHERFVPTMLAGVGPVPAVLLVVAADEGWMPQTSEHVAALDALGVRHGLLVVTRSDLADPADAAEEAVGHLAGTTLARLPWIGVSAATGAGLDSLRAALDEVVTALPAADPTAPVRLWVDRSFTIRGSGTVVTGTLGAGTLRPGDELALATGGGEGRTVRVRGLQALGAPRDRVEAVARVAVNLRGVDRDEVSRGDALLTPGRWTPSDVVDVEVRGDLEAFPPRATLHVGSESVPVRIRPLGGEHARLTTARALPLAAGDVALLRDAGGSRTTLRVTVRDTAPPPLARRGAASRRARELEDAGATPDGAALLRAAGVLPAARLRGVGAAVPEDAVRAGEWLVDAATADRLRARLRDLVTAHRSGPTVETGPTVEAARVALELPVREVVVALTTHPLAVREGRVVDVTAPPPLPAPVARAVDALREELAPAPFLAPEARRLVELGLGARELAAAERAGAVLRVADGVVLLPGADVTAARLLADLPQPFTLSEARQALGTTRRVAVPLLELLDRRRLTRRLPDDRRAVLTR